MSKKKKNQNDVPGVDTWRDGYQAGTTESYRWCVSKANEFAELAKTDDGRKAMGFIAQAIQNELDHRYPPKVVEADEGGDADGRR